jgi:hypothetical protein
MKRLMNILLVTGLTAGVVNSAEAQRNRNGGGSSRGENRETNVSPQRGGDRGGRANVFERGGTGNRYNSPANNPGRERQIVPTRESSIRNVQPREVARVNERDNRVGVGRVNTVPGESRIRNVQRREVATVNNRESRVGVGRVNRVPGENFDRDRGTRYNNNYAYNRNNNNYRYNNNNYGNNNNNYRYSNNNYRYNNNYYRSGYGSGYNRGFSFAYGPRYSIIPRTSISLYFGGSPYYFYNGFYYGYYGGYYEPIFPPIGLRIGFLPYGCSRLFIGGYPYYYNNGIYYRQYDDDYEVVDPPMGATVNSLPKGAKSVILNGEKMYELNGTYYKEDRNSKGEVIYTVVGKNGEINNTGDSGENSSIPGNNDVNTPPVSLQMGDIVNQLPEGSRVITINGEKMYVAPDDTYLKEESNGGVVQYKVVGK